MAKYWKWMLIVAAALLAALPVLAQDDGMATVNLGGSDELGAFLVGANGMTLYVFARDEPGASSCVDQCAANWPPLTAAEGERPSLAAGIPGMLGVIARPNGTSQVTFNGMPLYFWVNDAQPGDTTGHNFNEVWFVAKPATVSLGGSAELGNFLVGANGMTLYMFTRDEAGASSCVDQCAANWPPLTVGEGETPTLQPGLPGELTTFARADGSLQVAYNGMPLYFWVNDAQPGDATGQNFNEVWFVVQPPTLAISSSDDLGDFLVGPNGMTLYVFANDEPGVSSCVDQCAANWPPLTVGTNQQPTVGDGVNGEVSTIERADGSLQVTYNGMPLYYWINDVVPGDTTGHNFREVWSVAAP
jgi:predicted lipoprotein with Yx(FWY)xxD motif